MNKKLIPFQIAGPGYDASVKAISEIAYTACEYGAQQLRAAGKSIEDLENDEEAQRRFLADCHRGFAAAQSAIGEQVIAIDAEVRKAKQELKKVRAERDKGRISQLTSLIGVFANRELAFRRVEDYIYFMLLNREVHRYKRFFAHREIQNIAPDVLRQALNFADLQNRENALKFMLVADLTTGMHLADIVEIDRSGPVPEVSLIELKTGEMNRVLLELLTRKPDKAAAEKLNAMGPKAQKQLERIIRQHGRLKEAHKVLMTDRGFDALNQMPIALTKEPVEVDGYLELLIDVCVKATKGGAEHCRMRTSKWR